MLWSGVDFIRGVGGRGVGVGVVGWGVGVGVVGWGVGELGSWVGELGSWVECTPLLMVEVGYLK